MRTAWTGTTNIYSQHTSIYHDIVWLPYHTRAYNIHTLQESYPTSGRNTQYSGGNALLSCQCFKYPTSSICFLMPFLVVGGNIYGSQEGVSLTSNKVTDSGWRRWCQGVREDYGNCVGFPRDGAGSCIRKKFAEEILLHIFSLVLYAYVLDITPPRVIWRVYTGQITKRVCYV